MSKTGQARVLTPDQFAHLLRVIQEHRYPEKNTALVQISFKLGLRVQEIALLQIKDVAELGALRDQVSNPLNSRKSSPCLRPIPKVRMR
ncbi:hypothetical protein [Marinobacter salsuginis]|uniref:hypothetical protein n=1 Tax=Marinobacter salsuginis TaxID=418719 RepID=UPI001E5000B7|nr:hypothetical protein [Marinobacter salsuginis]